MPLVPMEGDDKKMIPDNQGGWYWLRLTGGDWQAVYVEPANGRWHSKVNISSFPTEVQNVKGEWGPQIMPPST